MEKDNKKKQTNKQTQSKIVNNDNRDVKLAHGFCLKKRSLEQVLGISR